MTGTVGVAGDPAAGAAALSVVDWLDGARDFGVVEAVREALPPGVDPVVYALTQLGDVWLLLAAVSLFAWYASDRRNGVLAVALALGALALVSGLKALFALPRPPDPLPAYGASGYGFPSGHALGATVVWGAMAWLSSWSTRQRRLAATAVLVVLVGLSRVFLGVHYLGSVLAGFAAGAVFLGAVLWLADRDPLRAFAVAGGVAALAVAAGAVHEGAAVLGGVLGGSLAWTRVDVADEAMHPLAALAGLGVFGGLYGAVEVLDAGPAVTFAATVVVVGGILAWPAVGARAHGRVTGTSSR